MISTNASLFQSIPVIYVKQAQSAFLDALYGFLDGLVHVAFTPSKPLPSIEELSRAVTGANFSSMLIKASNVNRDHVEPGLRDEQNVGRLKI